MTNEREPRLKIYVGQAGSKRILKEVADRQLGRMHTAYERCECGHDYGMHDDGFCQECKAPSNFSLTELVPKFCFIPPEAAYDG